MCGIVVGLCFGKLNKKDEEIRQRLLRYFTTELMILTEDRGKDATGAAVLFNDGDFTGIKRGERVTDFLAKFSDTKDYYGSLLKVWRESDINKNAKIFLGHCRQGTVGDKEENENNHPIKIGNLVGIHNGVIRNHDIIINKLGCKRDGKVDSEAIFRLFDHFTSGGKEPFTLDMCQEIVKRLDGQFAITLFNADNIEQIPIFRDGRPVELILIRPLGIMLAISELKFWKEVHYRYERLIFYHPELLGRKMPSLLDSKEDIEIKMMEDDSAWLFDLTKEVKADTVLTDLGEFKKMIRSGKMWQAPIGHTARTAYQASSYNTGARSATPTAIDKKKRRIFDNFTRQYVVKVGDTIVENKAVVIPVDASDENTKKIEKTTVVSANAVVTTVKPDTSIAMAEVESNDPEEEKASTPAPVEDQTTYKAEGDRVAAVREACQDVIDAECSVVEVEMAPIAPEMIEEAENVYRQLTGKERGYETMEDVLNDIEIQDAETAQTLGEVVVCNRARKAGWKAGYIAALRRSKPVELSSGNEIERAKKREKHIVNLKHMLLILARFYGEYANTSANNNYKTFLRNRLSNSVKNASAFVDVEEILAMCNTYEKSVIKEAVTVISETQKESKEG